MLRGRKYLPSSHSTNIHLLPSCCCRFPQRTRHHPINGWIDRYPYVQGNCTRRSRSKDQERASLLSGRLSRAYIDITTPSPHLPPPPPSRTTDTSAVIVCVSYTCTLTHARKQTPQRAPRHTRGNIITSVVCFPLIAIIGGT